MSRLRRKITVQVFGDAAGLSPFFLPARIIPSFLRWQTLCAAYSALVKSLISRLCCVDEQVPVGQRAIAGVAEMGSHRFLRTLCVTRARHLE